MTKSKYILWERRRDMAPLPVGIDVLLSLSVIAFSAIAAFLPGLLGFFFTCLSGSFFGILLCTSRRIFRFLTIPFSYAVGAVIMRDPVLSLCVLLYVLLGIVLAYCVFTERSLSVTTVALTVANVIVFAVFFTIAVTSMYGEGIKGSYIALYDEFSTLFREIFALISYPGLNGEMFTIPEDLVSALLEQSVMLMPCCLVLYCQLLGYGSAKLFRLHTIIFGYGGFFAKRRWRVTISLPAAIIFLVSLIIGVFFPTASVVSYSAITIAYIIMPAAAIAGYHSIFGPGGFYHRLRSLTSRIVTIVVFCLLCFLSPVSFAQMLAMYGSFSAISRALIVAINDLKNQNGPN